MLLVQQQSILALRGIKLSKSKKNLLISATISLIICIVLDVISTNNGSEMLNEFRIVFGYLTVALLVISNIGNINKGDNFDCKVGNNDNKVNSKAIVIGAVTVAITIGIAIIYLIATAL